MLALFVRTGVRGKTALDISRELLLQFGGLRYIVAASLDQFSKTLGLGLAKYVQIQAAKELSTRCLQENLEQRNLFENPHDVYHYLTHKL